MAIRRINTGRGGHWYKIDGVKADGVTTLINEGIPKPALTRWAAKSVAEYVADHVDAIVGMRSMDRQSIVDALRHKPWTTATEAAVKGSEVHGLAERLAHGEEVDVPDHLAGYVESAVRFLDEWQVRTVFTEVVVASRKWNYCGTADLIADIPGCGRVVADYKTARSGIFNEVALQLAAYRHATVYVDKDGNEQPMTSLGIEGALAVWIRSDGYDVFHVDTSDTVFRTFLHAAWIARTLRAWKETPPISESLPTPLFLSDGRNR